MTTPYMAVYDMFLLSINDVELLYPFKDETEENYQKRLGNVLKGYLKKAIVRFRSFETNLEYDDSKDEFKNGLRDIEIEILALLMLKEYYRKKLNFLASLKHSFSDKDWKSHDKSNQMNQYRQLLKETDNEIRLLTIKRSFEGDNGERMRW